MDPGVGFRFRLKALRFRLFRDPCSSSAKTCKFTVKRKG